MTAMDEIRYEVALKMGKIEKIIQRYGLPGIRLLTLFARDPDNPNMYLHISNDTGCAPLVWQDGLPAPQDGWVLAVIRPPDHSYREPDYYTLAAYDHLDRRWRTKLGTLDQMHTVIKWARLPEIGGESSDATAN